MTTSFSSRGPHTNLTTPSFSAPLDIVCNHVKLHRVDLLFDEAVTGAKRQLTLNVDVACDSCKGTGAEQGRLVTCAQCNGTGEVRLNGVCEHLLAVSTSSPFSSSTLSALHFLFNTWPVLFSGDGRHGRIHPISLHLPQVRWQRPHPSPSVQGAQWRLSYKERRRPSFLCIYLILFYPSC